MSWVDKLEDHGKKAVRERRKRLLRPQEVLVTVRQSSDNDPGEIAIGYYVVQDGAVMMTDENGKPLGKPIPFEREVNPRSVAASRTKKRWEETRGGFNCRLDYQRLVLV